MLTSHGHILIGGTSQTLLSCHVCLRLDDTNITGEPQGHLLFFCGTYWKTRPGELLGVSIPVERYARSWLNQTESPQPVGHLCVEVAVAINEATIRIQLGSAHGLYGHFREYPGLKTDEMYLMTPIRDSGERKSSTYQGHWTIWRNGLSESISLWKLQQEMSKGTGETQSSYLQPFIGALRLRCIVFSIVFDEGVSSTCSPWSFDVHQCAMLHRTIRGNWHLFWRVWKIMREEVETESLKVQKGRIGKKEK